MFLGEYQHTLDEKGRLVMPSKYRHRLADGVVVVKGEDRCLYVFSLEGFEEEAARLKGLKHQGKAHRSDRTFRLYERALSSAASDQQLDKQGRIAIPQALREYAGLDKDVVVVGVLERIEIWDAAAWSEASREADEAYAGIDEAIGGEGT